MPLLYRSNKYELDNDKYSDVTLTSSFNEQVYIVCIWYVKLNAFFKALKGTIRKIQLFIDNSFSAIVEDSYYID